MKILRNTCIEVRAATGEQPKLWADRLVDSGEKFAAHSRLVDTVGNRLHRTKQHSYRKGLRLDLRKDAFVKQVKKLRNTNEQRDAVVVKRINDPLRRDRIQKYDGRPR